MHDFLYKYATIQSKIDKIHHFSRLLALNIVYFCANTLLFRLLSTKFTILATLPDYQLLLQLIFFKSTIILRKYAIISPKTGKIRDIPRLSSKFFIELHSVSGLIGKLSSAISFKKLPRTLRNCPALQQNPRIFRKRSFV